MNVKTARLIASFLGSGYLRPAPGTWGTLAALPAAYVILITGGVFLLLALTVVAFYVGWIATRVATENGPDHDPGWIVIDEVVGMWIALIPVAYGAFARGVDVTALWPGWVSAFVLFRLFDIWKPWLVGRADRLGTPLGVMMDDVFAGLFAAIGTGILAGIAHGVLM
ncbi:phosphatidylglycerophosphatase A [Pacificoceanicola onchidii]|uniref:phosphatidylglycerophosphatase A family protein n=1 Tax=Pacificoceanicola onchidii TaxID=2562685 RepID=UPI0010A615B8|nr:phosphatidylglycerophosphatase A [Pacificoceanicola onchidii]